jgi:hypothetical protein
METDNRESIVNVEIDNSESTAKNNVKICINYYYLDSCARTPKANELFDYLKERFPLLTLTKISVVCNCKKNNPRNSNPIVHECNIIPNGYGYIPLYLLKFGNDDKEIEIKINWNLEMNKINESVTQFIDRMTQIIKERPKSREYSIEE